MRLAQPHFYHSSVPTSATRTAKDEPARQTSALKVSNDLPLQSQLPYVDTTRERRTVLGMKIPQRANTTSQQVTESAPPMSSYDFLLESGFDVEKRIERLSYEYPDIKGEEPSMS
jgi:hypothetical protein